MPMVSIIIPYYNSKRTIIRTLESIAGQTFTGFEIILVDDGSNDNTHIIVDDYIKKHKKIVFKHYYQENAGPSEARNLGISKSDAEYIAFLDSDDSWVSNKLEIQMKLMSENKIDLLGSNINILEPSGQIIRKYFVKSELEYISFYRLLFRHYFHTSSSVIRKKTLDYIGGFPEKQKYAEDTLLFARITRKYKTAVSNDFLVNTYKHLFGDSGLSGNLKESNKYELNNFKILRRENVNGAKKISFFIYVLVLLFEYVKYFRKNLVVFFRNIFKKNISMKQNHERGNSKFRFLDRYVGIPIIFALGLLKKRRKTIPDSITKAAFLKTAGIGDTILLSAVVRDFKDAYPDVHLTFFVASNNYEMAQLISGIDRVIKLQVANPLECIRNIKESGEYDIWIDFGPWPRINALLSYFSNARLKVGFKTEGQHRHYIYDLTAEHSTHLHELDNYKNLLKQLGIDCHNLPCISIQIPKCIDNRITIHIFPGGFQSYSKEWPDANWIEIIDQLTACHYEVFLTGAKIDREKAVQIKAQVANKDSVNIVAGEFDLKQTAKLLKSSILVISVNTGIMHLASALGCNLIALHGPTSFKRWGPLDANAISLQSGLQCSPCLNLGFEYQCQTNSCMKSITTKALMDAIQEIVPI